MTTTPARPICPRPLRLGVTGGIGSGKSTFAAMLRDCGAALIDADAIAALLSAYRQRPVGTELVQPEVDGQPGNPVVFSPRVREQMLAAPQGMSGRQWQARHPGQAWRWVTTDRRYVIDLDSPSDLARLASEHGIALHWPEGWGCNIPKITD